MRSYGVIMSLSIMTICLVPSASPALDISVGMVASDVSLGETLLIAGIASFLGYQPHVAVYHRDTWNLPLPTVLTALVLSRMLDVDHHRMVGLRSQGHGWGRIANDLGIHPGTFNQIRRDLDPRRMSNAEFEQAVMIWYLSQYYGVGQDRIHTWHRDGRPLLSILIALDMGAKSRRQVSDLFSARNSQPSWYSVAGRVGVSRNAARRPQTPKGGQELRAKARGARGRGQDRGPGR